MANSEIRVPPLIPAPAIEILLATYNGERYLREQIESLFTQTYAPLMILARDDGSTDATPAILAEYAASQSQRFRVLADHTPTGSAQQNFLTLMQHTQAPYVAFSDQDDVWLPSKLSLSMEAMQNLQQRHASSTPMLVFTDLQVVDSNLVLQAASLWKLQGVHPGAVHRMERLLGQSVATGCTMLLNRPLLELARRMPLEATMHDRWIALLASALGASAYLAEPTVLYRQHGANVVGAAAADSSLSGVATRVADNSDRRIARRRSECQAEALLRLHAAELSPAKAVLLRAYLESGRSRSRLRRLALTLQHGFFRDNPIKTAALLLDLARSASD